MAASKEDIRRWLTEGKAMGATHVVVVCDTFDWDDYPVFVMPGEDAKAVHGKYNGKDMQQVMEVYNLAVDLETQLSQRRVFNF
jgi:hypothetical protein